MNDLHHIMDDVIQQSFGNNEILKYFTRMLMGSKLDGVKQYSPDINGYTVTFIEPPHLSGYGIAEESQNSEYSIITKMFPFLCIDFTPPPTQVIASEVPARSGAIQFATEVQASGQMQLTCMDDSELGLSGFIKTWVSYVEDVSRGIVSPDDKYITPDSENFGELDYATSAYVIRFKPTRNLNWSDIVYVGKAVGIFPLNIPDKELIGRRDSNEITMLPISFSCTYYRQAIYGSLKEAHGWIIQEFESKCRNIFR